jgi:pilus assembly protein CpaB
MNRRVGLIATAIVLALIGTFAVYSYAHNADKRAVSKTRSAKVLIAQKRVSAGTSWSEARKGDALQEEKVPVDSVPSNAVPNLDASIPVDEVATADIEPGQIVVRPMFGTKAPSTGVLAIPAGKLAVTVQMSSSNDVAGFVQNGSEVAIFLTAKLTLPKGSPELAVFGGTDIYDTKMVLARVSVIATSQTPPGDLNGGKDSSSGNGSVLVTLALTQDEAQRVILAQQIGSLYLGLLSDTSVTAPNGGVTNLDVGTSKRAPIFVK